MDYEMMTFDEGVSRYSQLGTKPMEFLTDEEVDEFSELARWLKCADCRSIECDCIEI